MKVKEFEEFVVTKCKFPIEDVEYSFIGLAGEVGECMEWYKKKVLRGDPKFTDDHLKLELGDVLHYLVRIADYNGWTLKDIMEANMNKLKERNKVL